MTTIARPVNNRLAGNPNPAGNANQPQGQAQDLTKKADDKDVLSLFKALLENFKQLDKNKDGVLSADEIKSPEDNKLDNKLNGINPDMLEQIAKDTKNLKNLSQTKPEDKFEGLSLEDLVKAIEKMEKGTTYDNLDKLAEALNVNPGKNKNQAPVIQAQVA